MNCPNAEVCNSTDESSDLCRRCQDTFGRCLTFDNQEEECIICFETKPRFAYFTGCGVHKACVACYTKIVFPPRPQIQIRIRDAFLLGMMLRATNERELDTQEFQTEVIRLTEEFQNTMDQAYRELFGADVRVTTITRQTPPPPPQPPPPPPSQPRTPRRQEDSFYTRLRGVFRPIYNTIRPNSASPAQPPAQAPPPQPRVIPLRPVNQSGVKCPVCRTGLKV